MAKTKIEWATHSWSPITGCTKVSPGCTHCYAERMARRLAGRFGYPEAPNHFDITLHLDRLEQPLGWRKPRRIFVCSMGDLFHKNIPLEFMGKVFATMIAANWHTFQVLTKRPARAQNFISWFQAKTGLHLRSFRHIWLGVSVENQETANERRKYLRQTPATIKYVSYEPALGPVDWTGWEFADQIISGGENGPKARPSHPDWHRATRDFCQKHGIAYFMKQWGAWIPQILFPDIMPSPDGWGTLDDEGNWFPLTTPWNGRQGEDSPEREYVMVHVGKKRAGCLLDGVLWEEYPV